MSTTVEVDETSMKRERSSTDPVSDVVGTSEQKNTEYWIREGMRDRKIQDDYFLGDMIGRGASSVVYKCLRKGRSEWACKALKKGHLNKKSVQSEITILQKLKHPNIVQLKEVFETGDEVLLITELAPGGELFERIVGRGHYSEEDAAQAVKQILNGLQYLHSNGIVHRDLKPENLLYKTDLDDSLLKLADTGMEKMFSEEHVNFRRSCGLHGYTAPEVLLNKEYGFSADMWSLGVVIYIMLCGYEPFSQYPGDTEMSKNIIEGNYSFPSPWWDKISESVKELISKLLSLDPKSRPTANEALSHPWTLGISTSSLHMNETIDRLKEFNARRRFRVAIKAVMATQRALNLRPRKNECKCLSRNSTDVRSHVSESGKDVCCECSSIDGGVNQV